MFYHLLINLLSLITSIRCVSEGQFFGQFASFHDIENVVIVKEEGSGGFVVGGGRKELYNQIKLHTLLRI